MANLEGMWSFTVGDNMQWADPAYNPTDWDKIPVPGQWENHYPGYNGFAWYRRTFDIRSVPGEGTIALMLGYIDDVDEVFINGVKVGQSGSFPPDFNTAYNVERVYHLPNELLKPTNNVIAVRVFDTAGPGGIMRGSNFGIFYDNDFSLISLDLSGQWKFSTLRERGLFDVGFNDQHWAEIKVPAYWESQGYENYDGLAWYRTKFILPASLEDQELYLVLGKIDDMDKVYLNGDLIGRTEYLTDFNRLNRGNAHQLYRTYKIPIGKLRKFNVLVVEVNDERLGGGIYEGPIGLMTPQNARIIEERNKNQRWGYPIRILFEFLGF
jgi:hypothetical protein